MDIANAAIAYGIESAYRVIAYTSPLGVWRHLQRRLLNQWLPYDELRQLRWARLQQILRYCYEQVPFYRRLWREHGVDPSRFTSERDIDDLPIVNKEMLNGARLDGSFCIPKRASTRLVRTSGTTAGMPFAVVVTFREYQQKYANHLRQFYSVGWRLGMKSAALHHSGHGQFKGRYSGNRTGREPWHWWRELAFRFAHRRRLMIPYYRPATGDDRLVSHWYEETRDLRPFLIDTFYINVLLLCDYVERNHLERPSIPILFILNTLTLRERERIQQFFNCEVFNRYSPHECEGIAVACGNHRGMHVAMDSYFVEVLDKQWQRLPSSEIGHIVVTDLENYTMPLIRYVIGDMGHMIDEPCRCGRSFPLISDLQGRRSDSMGTRRGEIITPWQVEELFQGDEKIRFFQVLREGRSIRVKIVPKSGLSFGHDIIEEYSQRVNRVFGEPVPVEIETTDHVFFEPNGKFLFVKNVSRPEELG
jgi:phenylacetate-CoA ligase